MHVYTPYACLVPFGGQERASDSLKLELQAVLRGTRVLGTKPRSSGKTDKPIFIYFLKIKS